MNPKIINFLNICKIVFDKVEYLDGMEIPRDILLSEKTYDLVKPKIEEMKKLGLSSSSLTCLQKNAKEKQKNPLLNLVRQVLKANNYYMIPQRKADGSTATGKKKYKRFFRLKKVKDIKECQ